MQGNLLETQSSFPQQDTTFPSVFDLPVSDSAVSRLSLFEPIPPKFEISSLGAPLFSSQLQKKSRTLGYSITRHYFLFRTHLAYSSSSNPYKIKKFVELNRLKVDTFVDDTKNTKGSSKYGLCLSRSALQIKLYTEKEGLIEQWRHHLGGSCVMLNFADNYTLEELLGKGSNGKVMLATKIKTGEKYAVKVFDKLRLISQFKDFGSIVNEASILRKLNSENIVKLHEVYESSSNVYLVLEYIEGGELSSKLREIGRYSEDKCRNMIKCLLEALIYIHSQKIVHRDVKPANIIMSNSSKDSPIKLIDFGYAVDFACGVNTRRCGTPGYIAPEVLNSKPEHSLSEKIDVFSAGVILYQLLTGSRLFPGNTVEEILKSNKECSINTKKLEARNVSSSAIELVLQMLEKDPNTRISAFEALEHSFFTSLPSSRAEVPENPEDESRHDMTKYSFDYNNTKDPNSGVRSRVLDTWGSLHIITNIGSADWQKKNPGTFRAQDDNNIRNFGDLTPNKHLSVFSIISSADENSEEAKSEDRSPLSLRGLHAPNSAGRKPRGYHVSHVSSGASPYHKAAIMNSLKKSQLEDLKQIEGGPNQGTFTDYFRELESGRISLNLSTKRKSVV